MNESSSSPRRTFLKQTGLGMTGVALSSLAQPVKEARAAGANQRLRVGVIGCGNQGGSHIVSFRQLEKENVEIVYVCDPDESRRGKAVEKTNGAKPVEDFRRILDDDTIDAVSIATPDHWHTPAAILAMQAGKHVYVEKPCSHNFTEGKQLVAASAKYNKVVQHGTQMRSNQGFAEAVQMLHEGVIGDVLVAKIWNIQRRQNIGHAEPSDPPAGFNHDLWIGPAPMMPYQSNRHHYNWHWWYNFGTGDAGNDGVHEFDLARWGLGEERHPSKVAVIGGKYFFDDDQQFPDTMTATFEYPAEGGAGHPRQMIFEMQLWSTNYPYNVDNGIEFWGTEGKMFISRRGKFQLWGERNRKLKTELKNPLGMHVVENQRAFANTIREDAPATADAQTAHLSATLCHLANISSRVGKSFDFDPVTEQIVDQPEANALLSRSYREGHWAIPRV